MTSVKWILAVISYHTPTDTHRKLIAFWIWKTRSTSFFLDQEIVSTTRLASWNKANSGMSDKGDLHPSDLPDRLPIHRSRHYVRFMIATPDWLLFWMALVRTDAHHNCSLLYKSIFRISAMILIKSLYSAFRPNAFNQRKLMLNNNEIWKPAIQRNISQSNVYAARAFVVFFYR